MERRSNFVGASCSPGAGVDRTELVGLEPGEQALVSIEESTSIYDVLPERAFDNLFVVSVGRTPEDLQQEVERRGHDPSRVGVAPVTTIETEYDGPLWTTEHVSANDLTGVSIAFSRGFKYLQSGVGWFVFDDLSTLMMYAEPDRVYKLVNDICQRIHRKNVVGAFVVVRDLLDDETYQMLRHSCTTEIHLEDHGPST